MYTSDVTTWVEDTLTEWLGPYAHDEADKQWRVETTLQSIGVVRVTVLDRDSREVHKVFDVAMTVSEVPRERG